MRTAIYYYSATGNCLAIARELAQGIGEAEVLPVAAFRGKGLKPGAERVGIVFPIHAWGPPRTVEEFIGSLDPAGLSYVFAVASCGGTAAGALPRIAKTLRAKGGRLHAGFLVSSQGYMQSDGDGPQAKIINLVRSLSGPRPLPAKRRLPLIIEAVKALRESRPERSALAGAILGNFFHAAASKQFPALAAMYGVSPDCDGCGVCARVCPRENLALEGGRPVWKRDCDFCGACAAWCPKQAVLVQGKPASSGRHHAAVALGDVLLR